MELIAKNIWQPINGDITTIESQELSWKFLEEIIILDGLCTSPSSKFSNFLIYI